MNPSFERWLGQLTSFQSRREKGDVARPWDELSALGAGVDALAVGGLDYRVAALSLVELERASLCFEQRDFRQCLELAAAATVPPLVTGPVAELINAGRELLIGNVHLVRDADAASALEHFERAIRASGPTTIFQRGNAAINAGICHSMLGHDDDAIKSYELAAESYEAAGREEKVAIAMHCIGNAYRTIGDNNTGIRYLHAAMEVFRDHENKSGLWSAADDLSRAYLKVATERPEERSKWIELAAQTSDIATFASTEVWNTAVAEKGRLADLSEQLVNHTVTKCDLAGIRDDKFTLLGTLAMMKGRIRLVAGADNSEFLAQQDPELRQAADGGVPVANFLLVEAAFKAIAQGRIIALVDQFAMYGNQLMMGFVIVGTSQKVLGGAYTQLPGAPTYATGCDLRGRQRASDIARECQAALDAIIRHGQRCAMVLPSPPSTIDDGARTQLREWATELEPDLKRLGALFFPDEMLAQFRAHGVEHVILCVDPLFARFPYSALICNTGAILDEPWSLSVVTASTELIRLLDRRSVLASKPGSLACFGPDGDVNRNRGGDSEFRHLSGVFATTELKEDAATLDRLIASLSSGCWCHFRGHGLWTGDTSTSGIVLANHEVLSSAEYRRISGPPSFLFTAACLTGFGEAVGTEIVGSLVDYDHAGLLGAVLTNWPIHGEAATVTTRFFYDELRVKADAAFALKVASKKTRDLMPHPYLWAPFSLLGCWDVNGLLQPSSCGAESRIPG